MPKKRKKTAKKKAGATPGRSKRSTKRRPAIATLPSPVVPTVALTSSAPKPTRKAQLPLLSPAARRGRDLVKFLRIHVKRPYGPRGMNAIAALGREVGHLANIELGDHGQEQS